MPSPQLEIKRSMSSSFFLFIFLFLRKLRKIIHHQYHRCYSAQNVNSHGNAGPLCYWKLEICEHLSLIEVSYFYSSVSSWWAVQQCFNHRAFNVNFHRVVTKVRRNSAVPAQAMFGVYETEPYSLITAWADIPLYSRTTFPGNEVKATEAKRAQARALLKVVPHFHPR